MAELDTSGRIILVEDDPKIGYLLEKFLRTQGFSVRLFCDGREAIPAILSSKPDLVILDKELPSMDGVDVCQTLRPSFSHPILMLTAHDGEITEVTALQAGVDDFLTKPVRPRVLLARIDALLRRRGSLSTEPLQMGGLSVDPKQATVSWNGKNIFMSAAEFEVLVILASNAGTPVSRDELFWRLRGKQYDGKDRSMDMRIAELRATFRKEGMPEMIFSLRGQGYALKAVRS